MNKSHHKRFRAICEENGWKSVRDGATTDGTSQWTIEKWSPAGEDWPISLEGDTLRELADDLAAYIRDYEPEEHAGEIFLAKRKGDANTRRFYADAPDSLKDLLADAYAMRGECEKLWTAIHIADKRTRKSA